MNKGVDDMNVENIKKVRDFIASEPERVKAIASESERAKSDPGPIVFGMEVWNCLVRDLTENKFEKDHRIHCGTCMCIGGTAEYLMGLETNNPRSKMIKDPSVSAEIKERWVGEWLGLGKEAAFALFYPDRLVSDVHSFQSTREEVIDLLDGIMNRSIVFEAECWKVA